MAVTLQITRKITEVPGGMDGIWIPGAIMLATVRFATVGHNAEPVGAQVMDVQLSPADGVSLNNALFTVTIDAPVPLATVIV